MEKIIQEEVENFLKERGIAYQHQDFTQISMDQFINDLLKVATKEEVAALFDKIQYRLSLN
ncbi:MAG: hypothetical protein BroJett040_21070 [Oligoflexia bacterium]|nr:MAG: hypothetical protein BroJett040_21070 [Oligoflexia bacterium]